MSTLMVEWKMMLKTLPVLVVLLLAVQTGQGQCPDIEEKFSEHEQSFKRLHTSLLSTAKELQLAAEQISSAFGLDRNNDHGEDDFAFAYNNDGSGDDIPVDSHDGGSGDEPSSPQIFWRIP
ncbi:uncharacterized protein LOC125178510 [Hyalella azteca]|uniref:Uncharacterized protein LOC125178510 n=1 Tax=Hyalella azteca TaxID=294128 RepID=A0A979FQB1_HYAAZ|nr:uncharacterized protein LOC125178510 [Hyalella azteca]